MARGKRAESTPKPKKQKNKATTEADPGLGHNGPAELTDDQRFALTAVHKAAYAKALETKKTADAALKQVCKIAKAELGATAVDDIKDLIALDTPEGEAAHKAKVDRMVKVARWMGLPVGTQGSIFDPVDRQPAEDKAHAEGKRHGLAGDRQQNPHSPGTPQYQKYLDGFHDGQAVLAKGIRPMPPAEADELDALDPVDSPPESSAVTAH